METWGNWLLYAMVFLHLAIKGRLGISHALPMEFLLKWKKGKTHGCLVVSFRTPDLWRDSKGKNLFTDKYAQMKIRREFARNRFSCYRLQVKSSWKSPLFQRREQFPCTRQRGTQWLQCPHRAIRKFFNWDFLKPTFQLFKCWMFFFLIVCVVGFFFSVFWN